MRILPALLLLLLPSIGHGQEPSDPDAAFFEEIIAQGEPPLQDHLIPQRSYDDVSVIGGYYGLLNDAFREMHAPDVRVRLLVVPSFSPEQAIGIRHVDGAFRILYLTPGTQLWGYPAAEMLEEGVVEVVSTLDEAEAPDEGVRRERTEKAVRGLRSGMPATAREVPLLRCEQPVGAELARRIEVLWRKMLVDARPPEHVIGGKDGVTYRFSMAADGRDLSGEVWSPRGGSTTGLLVAVGERMRDYCNASGSGQAEADLTGAVLALEWRLNGGAGRESGASQ